MSDQAPTRTHNTAATISAASAVVGFLVLPIILGPVAVIAGFVGAYSDDKVHANWPSTFGILAGFGEIIYMLAQWGHAGLT